MAWNYTRNEWRRCEITPETGEEDVKLHSKRVGKTWGRLVSYSCYFFDIFHGQTVLHPFRLTREGLFKIINRNKSWKIHSKRVEKMMSSQLVSSVFLPTLSLSGVFRSDPSCAGSAPDATLETGGEDENYTRNEWRRWKLHSTRVEKMKITLETGG